MALVLGESAVTEAVGVDFVMGDPWSGGCVEDRSVLLGNCLSAPLLVVIVGG